MEMEKGNCSVEMREDTEKEGELGKCTRVDRLRVERERER